MGASRVGKGGDDFQASKGVRSISSCGTSSRESEGGAFMRSPERSRVVNQGGVGATRIRVRGVGKVANLLP